MGFYNVASRVIVALAVFGWTAHAKDAKFLISFGDSYSQTGFDVAQARPSPSNPLGNPAYPGWTSSGGPNWVGYLVKEYNATLLYSYNFAYGGATVDASLVKPYQSTVKSLVDQVKQFSDSIASKPTYAPWTASSTLFAIWMGVNDVGNSYYTSNVEDLLGKIMDRYFQQLEILYTAGARNFALLTVPPINKSPLMLGQSKDAQELEAGVIQKFNQLVAERLQAFVAGHAGTKGTVIDTQTPFNMAISNPQQYGSKDATCYNSDGKSCLWFNDYHPGTAIQRLVAQAVARSWSGMFFNSV